MIWVCRRHSDCPAHTLGGLGRYSVHREGIRHTHNFPNIAGHQSNPGLSHRCTFGFRIFGWGCRLTGIARLLDIGRTYRVCFPCGCSVRGILRSLGRRGSLLHHILWHQRVTGQPRRGKHTGSVEWGRCSASWGFPFFCMRFRLIQKSRGNETSPSRIVQSWKSVLVGLVRGRMGRVFLFMRFACGGRSGRLQVRRRVQRKEGCWIRSYNHIHRREAPFYLLCFAFRHPQLFRCCLGCLVVEMRCLF